jgi:hypothetical protein
MPKKSASVRSAAQRTKTKAQKSFELVRPASEATTEQEIEAEQGAEKSSVKVATAPTTGKAEKSSVKVATAPTTEKKVVEEQQEEEAPVSTTLKGSASARLAARRQATQRAQRSAASLITAEHFSYVRRDLITIAILASIMFLAIIVLYVMYGSIL